jgi:hypothetical protein
MKHEKRAQLEMNPQRKASETRKKGPVRNESSEKN